MELDATRVEKTSQCLREVPLFLLVLIIPLITSITDYFQFCHGSPFPVCTGTAQQF